MDTSNISPWALREIEDNPRTYVNTQLDTPLSTAPPLPAPQSLSLPPQASKRSPTTDPSYTKACRTHVTPVPHPIASVHYFLHNMPDPDSMSASTTSSDIYIPDELLAQRRRMNHPSPNALDIPTNPSRSPTTTHHQSPSPHNSVPFTAFTAPSTEYLPVCSPTPSVCYTVPPFTPNSYIATTINEDWTALRITFISSLLFPLHFN